MPCGRYLDGSQKEREIEIKVVLFDWHHHIYSNDTWSYKREHGQLADYKRSVMVLYYQNEFFGAIQEGPQRDIPCKVAGFRFISCDITESYVYRVSE